MPDQNTVTAVGLKRVLHSDADFKEVNQEWVVCAIILPYVLARVFCNCGTVTSGFKCSCLWWLLRDPVECAVVVAGRTAVWCGCSNFLTCLPQCELSVRSNGTYQSVSMQ